MTYTVVACDPETKALGVCLATSPLAVAARCPLVRGGVAAISSQCHSDWRLAYRGMEMAEAGASPDDILKTLESEDRFFREYRQFGIVLPDGRLAVHSPSKGKDWTGHLTGDGFITMGNHLAGPQVVEAMHATYIAETKVPFEERLLRTLEAGFAAGGETVGQLSAGIIVAEPGVKRPRTELRIDMANPPPTEGGDAVRDLRRVFNAYFPLVPYYAKDWLDNPQLERSKYLEEQAAR